jgi:hypothetical protein
MPNVHVIENHAQDIALAWFSFLARE